MVLLLNIVIYILVLRVLWKKKQGANIRKASESARRAKQARASISLCFLLGVTWIVGLFMITSPAIELQWIFTITNSLQGFALFFFYTVSHEKLHKEVGDSLYMSFTGRQRTQRTRDSVQRSSRIERAESDCRHGRATQLWRNLSGHSSSEHGDDWSSLSRSRTVRSARVTRTDSIASNSSHQTAIKEKQFRHDSSKKGECTGRFSTALSLTKKPNRLSFGNADTPAKDPTQPLSSSSDNRSLDYRTSSVRSATSARPNVSVSVIPEDRMERLRFQHACHAANFTERRRSQSEESQSSDKRQQYLTAEKVERFSAPLPPPKRRNSSSNVVSASQHKRHLSRCSKVKEASASMPDLRLSSPLTTLPLPLPTSDVQAIASVSSSATTAQSGLQSQQLPNVQGNLSNFLNRLSFILST